MPPTHHEDTMDKLTAIDTRIADMIGGPVMRCDAWLLATGGAP